MVGFCASGIGNYLTAPKIMRNRKICDISSLNIKCLETTLKHKPYGMQTYINQNIMNNYTQV